MASTRLLRKIFATADNRVLEVNTQRLHPSQALETISGHRFARPLIGCGAA